MTRPRSYTSHFYSHLLSWNWLHGTKGTKKCSLPMSPEPARSEHLQSLLTGFQQNNEQENKKKERGREKTMNTLDLMDIDG